MNPVSHTVFSDYNQKVSEQSESKKISYWLKKLFDQQEQKVKKSPPNIARLEKSPEQIGFDENIQNHIRKRESDVQLVKDLVKKSNRSIISISSLFPWDLFPNTIRVEESRVIFIFRQFMTYQSHSVDIADISNVFIETSFLFATLQVVSRTFVQNDVKIGHLKKRDAVQARMIIEGLRMFMKSNIDTSDFEIPDLLKKIEQLHSNSTE